MGEGASKWVAWCDGKQGTVARESRWSASAATLTTSHPLACRPSVQQAVTLAGISFESFGGYTYRPAILVRSLRPPGDGEYYGNFRAILTEPRFAASAQAPTGLCVMKASKQRVWIAITITIPPLRSFTLSPIIPISSLPRVRTSGPPIKRPDGFPSPKISPSLPPLPRHLWCFSTSRRPFLPTQ